MTITITEVRKEYTGNASTTTFPFSGTVYAVSDIVVHVAGSLQVQGVHYDVVGTLPGPVSVVFKAAYIPALDASVIIECNIPETQTTDLPAAGRYTEANVEQMSDKTTRLIHQLKGRSVLLPLGSPVAGPLALPPLQALKFLRVNPAGTGFELVTASQADIVGILDDTVPSCTLAGLPPAGTVGRLRALTDDDQGLWYDNGLSYVPLGGPFVNVRRFGAKGDGVTDDTAAIQAAVNSLPSKRGTIYLPPGIYLITDTITIYSGTVFKGSGMESTIIQGAFSGPLVRMEYFTLNVEVSGCWVESLTVDGVDKTNGGHGVSVLGDTTGGNATRQSGLRDVRIINCERAFFPHAVQDFAAYNCQFRLSTYGTYYLSNDDPAIGGSACQQIAFYNCDFRENTYALSGTHLGSGSKPYMWLFLGCHVETNTYGFYFESKSLTQVHIIATKFEGTDNEALYVSGLEAIRCICSYFNGNAKVSKTQQIYIDSGYGDTCTTGNHSFRDTVFNGIAGEGIKALSINYTRNVVLDSCGFAPDPTVDPVNPIEIVESDVVIRNHYGFTYPNPTCVELRTLSRWITPEDGNAVRVPLAAFPKVSGQYCDVFVRSVEVHVLEAFQISGGTYCGLQVGTTFSSQQFTQVADLLATGLKTPVWNNQGYTHVGDQCITTTIATDGTLVAGVGKALVFVTMAPVPAQPS